MALEPGDITNPKGTPANCKVDKFSNNAGGAWEYTSLRGISIGKGPKSEPGRIRERGGGGWRTWEQTSSLVRSICRRRESKASNLSDNMIKWEEMQNQPTHPYYESENAKNDN